METKMKKKIQQKAGMAAAVILTVVLGVLLFHNHWEFELPSYPNVDEQLSLDCIYNLMNQHLYAGDIYILDFFRYPHLTFYYAVVGVRILGKVLAGMDTTVLLRYVVCGTAILSNICLYFAVKIMTGSRKWGYIGLLLGTFSLYSYSYLFYTGPDTLMFAVANVILLLGCVVYQEKQEDRAVYLWYPLLAICIGLAMAAKYHGILFGLFWLALHIHKKYYKNYRNNFLFFINCIVLALVFVVCNYSLLFYFKDFIGDNMYNLNHYAWGHPGIEHNLPLLGYVEVYGFTSYGVIGALLLLLGIVRLIRQKDWKQLVVFLLMPVVMILLLARYQIVLGRNLSLVIPYAFLFMLYGLMEIDRLVKEKFLKRKPWNRNAIWVVVLVLVGANVITVVGNYRYDLTYTQAEQAITEQIPEGSTIYCTSYAPQLDQNKYEVVEIGEDISLLPEQLAEGEYYIDVEYATGYFTQQKDYLICRRGDMYPDKKAAYLEKIGAYTLQQTYQGISYGKEWKYRVGYLDIFRYSPEKYYVGPTISIYSH